MLRLVSLLNHKVRTDADVIQCDLFNIGRGCGADILPQLAVFHTDTSNPVKYNYL